MAFALKIDNKVQRIAKLTITYSNDYFYAFYSIESLSSINYSSKIELIEVDKNQSTTLYPIKTTFTGKSYIYDCVNDKQRSILFKRFPQFKKETDLQGILNNYGLKYKFKFNSTKELFIIPECNIKSLLSYLEDQIQVLNGSASNYLLDLRGEIYGTDYKISMGTKAIWLNGNVSSDNADIRWMFTIPYELYDYTSSLANGIYKDVNTADNSIQTKAREQYMFTIEKTEQKENKRHLLNFYREFYTSRRIEVQNVKSPIKLGDRVNISNNIDGVVDSVVIEVPLNDEDPNLNVVVVCPF